MNDLRGWRNLWGHCNKRATPAKYHLEQAGYSHKCPFPSEYQDEEVYVEEKEEKQQTGGGERKRKEGVVCLEQTQRRML